MKRQDGRKCSNCIEGGFRLDNRNKFFTDRALGTGRGFQEKLWIAPSLGMF